jgi:hypothetical protein
MLARLKELRASGGIATWIVAMREEVAVLRRPDGPAQYVSRGAVDHNGDLFFGHCAGPAPVGLFKVEMPRDRKKRDAHLPIRMWG